MSTSSLLVLIVDVSPLVWGERDLLRERSDKKRAVEKKSSVGPARLDEVLQSIASFSVAFQTIEQQGAICIIAVADNESSIVFPRKDQLTQFVKDPGSLDRRSLQADFIAGAHQVLVAAAKKAPLNNDPANRQAAIAAAFSKALCYINRCLVAAQQSGVTALQTSAFELNQDENDEDEDDNTILALSSTQVKKKKDRKKSGWSPRILIVQASEDRSRDYNAMMNCAFCAAKQNIVVDACFLGPSKEESSSFLEQVVDLTGGVWLVPTGASQAHGALTEVLFATFLPTLSVRNELQLPTLSKVDFRARCFDTGEVVDRAVVCNQCLSIFKRMPSSSHCPTCGALIVSS